MTRFTPPLPPGRLFPRYFLPFNISAVSGRWRKFGGSMAEDHVLHFSCRRKLAEVWRKYGGRWFVLQLFFNVRRWFGKCFIQQMIVAGLIIETNRKKTGSLAEEKWFHVASGPFRRQALHSMPRKLSYLRTAGRWRKCGGSTAEEKTKHTMMPQC